MKNYVLVLSLFLIIHTVAGQDNLRFNFNNAPMKEALDEIETRINKKFYYADTWIDTLKVNETIEERSIEDLLESLFLRTKLNFVELDDRIILTYNSPIATELAKIEETQSELVYVYSREYLDDQSDFEKKTYEIGNKSLLRLGGKAILAGFVRDRDTQDPIPGAVVYLPNTSIASVTDNRGFYTLNLPKGLSQIHIQFTGMKTTQRKVMMYSDGSLNIQMIPDVIVLDDVLLEAERGANVNSTSMGIEKFNLQEMKNVPKILGENDIVQVALALPGVQSVGEGAGGINIRGGKVDQNLMLLNNATIYNPFHFFGFFSSFNADVISDAQLYKSSIPASYGGRLSSVFDVGIKKGNKEKFTMNGGISPVTTRIAAEVPLIKEKTSLVTGIRTTYSDWVLSFVDDENIKNSNPFFFDGVLGIDHKFSDNSQVQASVYYSKDEYSLTTDSIYSYTNFAGSVNWNQSITNRLLLETNVSYSNYEFGIDYETIPENSFSFGFDIKDMGLKVGLDYILSDKHQLTFGGEARYYLLNPGFREPLGELSETEAIQVQEEKGLETALFVADEWTVNDRLSISAGLRYSIFNALGPKTVFTYNEEQPFNPGTIADTLVISDNGSYQTYSGPEYRVSARYSLTPSSSIKGSINRTRQNIHILSNNISVAPTNTWKLSDNYIEPQIADQISLGYFQNITEPELELSAEVYYKRFDNLLEFKTGSDLVLNEIIETDVLQGEGFAYGVELLVKKKRGKLNGWIGYTYSRSKQKFDSQFEEETINNGEYFPTNFDKPHDFSLVSNYKLSKRYSVSLNVNYSTGRPITYPTGKYVIGGTEVVQYSDRNQFRLPNYFRVDLGINIEGNHKINKPLHGFWTISVYNLLGRDNVYSIFFVPEAGRIKGYQLSVFASPIPTITYNFRF